MMDSKKITHIPICQNFSPLKLEQFKIQQKTSSIVGFLSQFQQKGANLCPNLTTN
jgi:hypothetical protein